MLAVTERGQTTDETAKAQVDAIGECHDGPRHEIQFATADQLPEPVSTSKQPGAQGISRSEFTAAGLEHDPSDLHRAGNQPTKPAEPQALSGVYSESSARPANSAARPRIAQGGQTERSGVSWHKLRHAEHLPQRIVEQLRAPHTTANDLEHQQLSRTPDTHEPMTFPELIPLSAARIR